MPWKERTAMSERQRFIAEVLAQERSFSAVCRSFGISRKTGYKWMERARNGESLEERSRAPHHRPHKTHPEMEQLVLDLRDLHPAWGSRKLCRVLQNQGVENVPCKSTVMDKIAQLYEKEGEYVKAVGYLDMLLSTYEPKASNYDLILRIGTLLEHKVNNDSLTELFFSSIEGEYYKVKKVHDYAKAKLRRLEEKKLAAAVKPAKKKAVKRVYSEDDEEVLEELKEIIEKYVDDLQDFKKAEREMEDLWEENNESLATLDIMKALVDLNMKKLLDADKAAKYYVKWLEENPNDPLYKEYTLKLYDHYMDVMKDGNKALRLLQDYVTDHPISLESLDIELKLAKTNEIRLRNYDEALRSYQRIIDTRQNDVTVHEAFFRMGFVYREGFANYNEAIKTWQTLIDDYYNNDFSDQAQYAIAYTYEAYLRDYTKARAAYNLVLNRYPNSSLQNDVRNAILRIEGK